MTTDDLNRIVQSLVNRWCERKALRPLSIVLPYWPMPNGFTDEAHNLLAALRHARAMCRQEISDHNEEEDLQKAVVILTQALFPMSNEDDTEKAIDRIIDILFKSKYEGD